jgi:transposase
MLNKEDWMYIKAQREWGVYMKDIAAELGVHPRTVRRSIERGGPPSGKRPRVHRSKLDPYKPMIDELTGKGVWNAVVILRVIEEQGYDGEISIVRHYIKPKRPMRAGRATVRFETPPGHQMQSDWGEVSTEIAGEERKVCFIVNELG